MTVSNYSYQAPGVTVTNNGAQTIVSSGPAQNIITMIGTASQGPDFPIIMTPAQALQSVGDPRIAASLGHTLPLALLYANSQHPIAASRSFLVQVCRVGVTRATVPVLDQTGSPLTCFNIVGIGQYAGSAGNNLSITVTVVSTAVTVIQVFDTSGIAPVLKQSIPATQFDLTSTAKIYAAINGQNPVTNPRSIIQATSLNAAAMLPIQQTVVPTGGLDGLGTAANHASVAAALASSLYVNTDYLWLGFDASAVVSAVGSHINTAVSQNNYRKWCGGPKYGSTYSALTTSYLGSTNSRYWVFGHDGLGAINPVSGVQTYIDGFYAAAAFAGLKASCGPENTCVGWPLNGFTSTSLPPDKTTALTTADLDLLASNGLIVLQQRANGTVAVRDAITTVPQYTNNQLNPYSQANVQDIDDAVNYALVGAVLPYKAQPAAPLPVQINQLTSACFSSLAALGDTINGINSLTVSADPLTGVPDVNLSYITRYPNTRMNITTQFTYL